MARRAPKPLDESITGGSKACHPASTPEERDNQMISLAYDRAEQQLRDGTASSQVIVHFLKLGNIKSELELEKLKKENTLLDAKATAIESTQRIEELYSDAIIAMKKCRGENFD
jgi:hypothetical protein